MLINSLSPLSTAPNQILHFKPILTFPITWALGAIQQSPLIGGKITVNFEQQGKVVINGSVVELDLVN